ncbi:MAG: dihydrodipicolinate synthase family protein [Acidimicrobiales bacterium]
MSIETRAASTFVISITPFTQAGDLDEAGLRAHLQRLGRSGIGVYVAGSGSGEGYTLTLDERRRVMEIAGEELSGVVPVRVMGVEPRTAAEAIELGRVTAEVGLDAMQLYSLDMGHGYRPRSAELETYLNEALDAVTCPVVISTHQSVGYRYPVDLLASTVQRYDHVIGLNITTPDIGYLAAVIEAVDGAVDVHVGGPMHALTALGLGAQGYLSSEGNIAPKLCMSLVDAHTQGRGAAVSEAFTRILRLFRATQAAGGIVGTKAALRRLGAAGGWPRSPRLTGDDTTVDALVAVIADLDLVASEGLD